MKFKINDYLLDLIESLKINSDNRVLSLNVIFYKN